MYNFNFYNPVRIEFGKGQIAKLSKLVPQGANVLITYGGGSIKKNGVYDQVIKALEGFNITEFSGIEPNPHYETLMKAVDLIKQKSIDFVLAVGGGSVIDGTKFIVAAAEYKGSDPWDIVVKGAKVESALPFGTVLTLPATGSEMNSGAVISKEATKEKFAFNSKKVFPKFSILDPETTYSLPVKQLRNGIVDTFVHVMEQYFGYRDNSLISERFAEGILKTLIEIGPRICNNPDTIDYDDRANFMWAATMGLNKLIACGVKEDWATHNIGHELTALYGLDHGITLAIILPGVMEAVKDERRFKLLQYGERIWNISPLQDNAAEEAIQKTEEFFNSLGMKTKLLDYGLGKEAVDEVVNRFKSRKNPEISGLPDVNLSNLERILLSRI